MTPEARHPVRMVAVAVTLLLAAAGCASGSRPTVTDDTIAPGPTDAPETDEPAADDTAADDNTAEPADEASVDPTDGVAAPDGRRYPGVADDPAAVGARLAEVEAALRATDPTSPGFADLAHEQQMIYRTVGRTDEWHASVLAEIPPESIDTVSAHIAARAAIGDIGHGDPPENVPAWRIIEPRPAAELRSYYDEASAATGIDWAYLAAINLIETGYGRIDGVSTANAQGPMQFLPTTWEEVGEGSIHDPHDAILGAARYLVRRGGPEDMDGAIWGYNNSDAYVEAVSTYADLFRRDEAVFEQTHAWEIHYSAAIDDLWLPVGYERLEAVPAADHVADAPWSLPPA